MPEFTEAFRDDVDGMPPADRMLVFRKIIQLLNAENPTDQNEVTDIKRLKAPEYRGLWRKRAGNWRILYAIHEQELMHLNTRYKGRIIFSGVVIRRDL